MAYHNPKPYGWCPRNDYQVHEVTEPALRKRFDRPQHQKGHVAFKTNNEEPTAEVKVEASPPVAQTETTVKSNKQRESVDQDADMFIKQEHRRIELARLMSLGLAYKGASSAGVLFNIVEFCIGMVLGKLYFCIVCNMQNSQKLSNSRTEAKVWELAENAEL